MENSNEMTLEKYAFCGLRDQFIANLEPLEQLAEKEKWTFDDDKPLSILSHYLKETFKQCYAQNKIEVSQNGNYSCFNTGLLTENCNDIICLFMRNAEKFSQEWKLRRFVDKSDREFMSYFDKVPEIATYTDNYEELYYNPELELILNADHILDDNWERINQLLNMNKKLVKCLMSGTLANAKLKIARNLRLVIPQFYNGKIMYLMPLEFTTIDEKTVTMALAIEKTGNKYRGNTILTKEMAYGKARIIMKPESNWLV